MSFPLPYRESESKYHNTDNQGGIINLRIADEGDMETGKIEHSMYSLLDRLPVFSEESDREIIRRDKEDRRERRGKDAIEEEILPHEE